MDHLSSLLKLLNIERIEQWHVVACAAATSLALCVFTYLCYRLIFRKKSIKPKKPKGQKKRPEDRKTMSNSATTSVNNTVVASTVKHLSTTATKTSKTVPKKAVAPSLEAHSKPEVQTTKLAPVKTQIAKHADSEPNADSSSDATDGQWIEVKKTGKKEGKNQSTSDAPVVRNKITEGGDITIVENLTGGKKKVGTEKKPQRSGAKQSGAGSRHTAYERIEEPVFPRPVKPARHSSAGDSPGGMEEDEWQEVRFSRKGRKSHNKD